MTLSYIVLATLAGGLLSVVIAASLTLAVLGRVVKGLVSLSAGVLLGRTLPGLTAALRAMEVDARHLVGGISGWKQAGYPVQPAGDAGSAR